MTDQDHRVAGTGDRVKIAIIRPGAMGCLFASLLDEAGHQVWLLDRSPERARELARSGVRIEGIGGRRIVHPRVAARAADIGGVDLVFMWVKAYDTASAAESMADLLAERTQVITLQNGYGNAETIQRFASPSQVITGATSHGATYLGVGQVRHAGAGDTAIGRLGAEADDRVRQVAALLTKAGIETGVSARIEGALWRKLVINAAINPLTAIARLRNGQLLESPETLKLLDAVVEEAKGILSRAKVDLPGPDVGEQVRAVCRATAANQSSMLQDVERGRRTEIEAINGALVALATDVGLGAPVNELLTNLVSALTECGGTETTVLSDG